MTSEFKYIPIFLLYLTTILQTTMAGTIAHSVSASRNIFAADIFKVVADGQTQNNVVFSPASIQSCATLAYFGAKGKTADEMRTALKLGAGTNDVIAKNYGEFLKATFKSQRTGGPQLRMANRIYVNEGIQIKPEFNKIAAEHFDSQAETVNFADAANTVKNINTWVENQTENKIKDLLTADSVNGETSAVLVNAIYFKAKWVNQFSKSSTQKSDFFVDKNKKVSVDMMYISEPFKYADLPELDATALEMPYENSDISMLVVLPNKIDGLKQLEDKLTKIDLNEISSKMRKEDVDVFLPKFKIEFDIDLKKPLQQLGMSTMFSNAADFGNLFTEPHKISEARHKAFLDVNEAGSEAAAATFMKIVPMSLNLEQKRFSADHPFVFAIRNTNAVYFAGHVAKF